MRWIKIKLENDYLKIFLYGLISSSLIILVQIILIVFENNHQQLILNNLYLFFIIIPVTNYIIILLFNIMLLNGLSINFEIFSEGNKWRYSASYCLFYLLFILIIVTLIQIYLPHSIRFGENNTEILGFNRYILILYISIFPFLYIKFQNKLNKLRWF